MVLNALLAALAFLSLIINLWQWVAARRFPLHQRISSDGFFPALTLLKPLKGYDSETRACLQSWLRQEYTGPVQVLFGVASENDPVCTLVRDLITSNPECDAQLVVCPKVLGANAKVSTLIQLQSIARNDIIIVSDADVRIPPDFLRHVVGPMRSAEVGLVNCFYSLANPVNWPMRWEAVAVNADFWSQVLQSQTLKPIDFALGAVMAVKREHLEGISGFKALSDYLADDYQLGHLVSQRGVQIVMSPMVAECWSDPMNFKEVWSHQLRWARTIRICQPAPYFFSILSNATLWPLIWVLLKPGLISGLLGLVALLLRISTGAANYRKLTGSPLGLANYWLVPAKDLFQTGIWGLAFLGNRIQWRGKHYRVMPRGLLVELAD